MRTLASAPIFLFLLIWLTCATGDEPAGRASVWEDARQRGVEFRAVGNEPGWSLEIGPERIVFEFDYGASRIAVPAARPLEDGGRRTWLLEDGERTARADVFDRECLDTMADDPPYPAAVEVQLEGRTFRGCGMDLN